MEFPEVNQSFDNKDREVLLKKGFDVRELGTKVRELVVHWQTIGKAADSEGGMINGGVVNGEVGELQVGINGNGEIGGLGSRVGGSGPTIGGSKFSRFTKSEVGSVQHSSSIVDSTGVCDIDHDPTYATCVIDRLQVQSHTQAAMQQVEDSIKRIRQVWSSDSTIELAKPKPQDVEICRKQSKHSKHEHGKQVESCDSKHGNQGKQGKHSKADSDNEQRQRQQQQQSEMLSAFPAGPVACCQHASGVISQTPCGAVMAGVGSNPHAVLISPARSQNLDPNSGRACGDLVLNERLDPLRADNTQWGAGILANLCCVQYSSINPTPERCEKGRIAETAPETAPGQRQVTETAPVQCQVTAGQCRATAGQCQVNGQVDVDDTEDHVQGGDFEAHGPPDGQTIGSEAHGSLYSQPSTVLSTSEVQEDIVSVCNSDDSRDYEKNGPELRDSSSEDEPEVGVEDESDDNDSDYDPHDEFIFGDGVGGSDHLVEVLGPLRRSADTDGTFEADGAEISFLQSRQDLKSAKNELIESPPTTVKDCRCCRESADKRRKQRRRRAAIIRAQKSDGNDKKDDTVAGSLPASDFAQGPMIETSVDKLMKLCRGQGDVEDDIMRALQRSALPKEERSPMDELICQMRGGTEYSGGTIAICEGRDENEDEHALAAAQEWVDVEFEVALDSGSTDNVCHKGDAPGYTVMPSPGSKRGQNFVIGNGKTISNDGQINLNLETMADDPNSIASIFQVAGVSRPLMSVGKICDNDMDVIFGKDKARVLTKGGAEVCTFTRSNGGLYLAKFRLKKPADGFGRQG